MPRPPPRPPLFPSPPLFRSARRRSGSSSATISPWPRRSIRQPTGTARRSEEDTPLLHTPLHIISPLFFKCPGHPRALPSSPPRRSSDLHEGGRDRLPRRSRRGRGDPYVSRRVPLGDRKRTRPYSTHRYISYPPFFLNAPATPAPSPLPLPAALPICTKAVGIVFRDDLAVAEAIHTSADVYRS